MTPDFLGTNDVDALAPSGKLLGYQPRRATADSHLEPTVG